MKRLAPLLVALFLSIPTGRASDAPDDRFVMAYSYIEQAESFLQSGQAGLALERFQAAEAALLELQGKYPSWNEKVVSYRINYVREKMAPLAKLQRPGVPPKVEGPAKPTAPTAPVVTATSARVAELEQVLRQVVGERDLLQAKLREALAAQPGPLDPRELARAEERVTALEKENSLLKASLEQAKAEPGSPADAASVVELKKRLGAVQREAADLEKDNQRLDREVAGLKKRVAELSGRRGKDAVSAEEELNALRARLAVFEAAKVPYTAEELAFFKPASPATAVAAKEPVKEVRTARPPRPLPPGVGPLLAEAQAAFVARRYAEAEQKFKDVLRIDSTNPGALAFLAAAQMELKRPEEAEANLRKALAEDPEHPFSLAMLGYLTLLQEKYDEALDTLSRAAQQDPKNPNIQNNLGITLSKLGQPGPAETAFRKALQLLPDFEDAHYNLAVIYANQEPPYLELARFHYRKAVAAGHAKDAALEQLMNVAP